MQLDEFEIDEKKDSHVCRLKIWQQGVILASHKDLKHLKNIPH